MAVPDYYDILGVSATASQAEIKTACQPAPLPLTRVTTADPPLPRPPLFPTKQTRREVCKPTPTASPRAQVLRFGARRPRSRSRPSPTRSTPSPTPAVGLPTTVSVEAEDPLATPAAPPQGAEEEGSPTSAPVAPAAPPSTSSAPRPRRSSPTPRASSGTSLRTSSVPRSVARSRCGRGQARQPARRWASSRATCPARRSADWRATGSGRSGTPRGRLCMLCSRIYRGTRRRRS